MSRFQSHTTPMVLANDLWHVEFVRRGDRLAHVISRVVDGRPQPLLVSVEGTHEDNWPPSPPLQEIHFEEREGSKLALPVGMAGKSHWSISIELSDISGRLTFDVACRVKTMPQFLGSTYALLDAFDGHDASRPQLWKLDVEPIGGVLASKVCRKGDELAIVSAVAGAQLPATIRWQYVLSPAENSRSSPCEAP